MFEPGRLPQSVQIVLILLALVLVVACGPSPSSESTGEGKSQAEPRPLVGVGHFVDARRTNNSNLELPGLPQISRYINETDLGPWIAAALGKELTRNGFPVVQFAGVVPDTVRYTVSGSIVALDRQGIVLRLLARKGGLAILDREYAGRVKGFDNPNARLSIPQTETLLAKTYHDLVKQIMGELTRALR